MTHTDLDFNGKIYISSNRASELTGYTNDYVGQLARIEKIKAKKIGRAWFVEKNSILEHKKTSSIQKKEVGLIPPVYVPKIPILFEKKVLVPALVSIFLIVSVVVTPYIAPVVHRKVSSSALYIRNVQESLIASFSVANIKIKKFSKSSRDFISTSVVFVRTSSSDLFSTLAFEDSLNELRVNVASVGGVINNFLSDTQNYLNIAITKLAVNVYTSINNIYASSLSILKTVPSVKKNLVLNTTASEKGYTSQTGLVIVPTSGDETVDKKEREDIKERFSDEVSVVFDETGGSGVITPVFKNNRDESYSFVMVPINRGI